MEIIKKYILGILGILMLFGSCNRQDIVYDTKNHKVNEEEDNNVSGISFEMESDSLEEEIEEIYFHPREWEEEGMNADL